MKNTLLFFLLLVTFSCNQSESNGEMSNQISTVKKETIEMHDVVMADMGKLRSLRDSLLSLSVRNDSIESVQLRKIIFNLDSVDKAMWDWMHNYNVNFKSETDSATLVYFHRKYLDIQQIKQLFENSISSGQSYLSTSIDGHAQ